ncbi:2-polyprenyl-6-methoxyphenol hydroxylase-like FAD-dependent oxidoreductase [Bradyrhizobium sp. GM7.3]
MKAIIIGAGIGGLTTALSLHAAGIDVEVFETVRDIKPLGQGINLQPNGVREFTELGLGEGLAVSAIETSTLSYYNKLGQLIWTEPRGLRAGYKWPQYSIHRGDLQAVLLTALRERAGEGSLHLGFHLDSFDQDETRVRAHFIDRQNQKSAGTFEGDILIGADGINSRVRRILHPNEGPPVDSGRVQWRGSVIADPFLDGRTQVMIGHREQRTVIYPMSKKVAATGKSQINWLTVLGGQWNLDKQEVWDRRVPKERFFAPFADWNFGWIDVAGLIEQTTDIYEHPKVDRDALPKWSFGRVTLLGDAAHPMRPIGSQAGTQAIIDARVLAKALAASPLDSARALVDYEKDRLPVVTEVMLRNREYGPEIVMQMAEERAPSGFTSIEEIIPRHELESIARDFKIAAGFDPEILNQRPSLSVADSRV